MGVGSACYHLILRSYSLRPHDSHVDEIPTFLKRDHFMVVTSSVGIVGNESEEQEITAGDLVHIRKGENHWHWRPGRVPHRNHSGLESGKSLAVMRTAKEKGATLWSSLTP